MPLDMIVTALSSKVVVDTAKMIGKKLGDIGLKVFFENKAEDIAKGIEKSLNKKVFERRFENHDLQRSVHISFLEAVKMIANECLKQSTMIRNEYQVDLGVIREATKHVKKEINEEIRILKDKTPEELDLDFQAIGQLINPIENVEMARDVEGILLNKASSKYNIPTPYYEKLLKEHLYDYACKFFALEIKENERVHRIFIAQSNVENIQQIKTLNTAIALVADVTFETNENVKILIDMVVDLREKIIGGNRIDSFITDSSNYINSSCFSVDLQKTQFRIDNAELIDQIEELANNLNKIAVSLYDSASVVENFLSKTHYIENKLKNEELAEELKKYHDRYESVIEENRVNPENRLLNHINYFYSYPLVNFRNEVKEEFINQFRLNELEKVEKLLDKTIPLYNVKIKQGFRVFLNLETLKQAISTLNYKLTPTSQSIYYQALVFMKKTHDGAFPLNNDFLDTFTSLKEEIQQVADHVKENYQALFEGLRKYLH